MVVVVEVVVVVVVVVWLGGVSKGWGFYCQIADL